MCGVCNVERVAHRYILRAFFTLPRGPSNGRCVRGPYSGARSLLALMGDALLATWPRSGPGAQGPQNSEGGGFRPRPHLGPRPRARSRGRFTRSLVRVVSERGANS